MKTILIICETDLSKDPRVIRQIKTFKDTYKVCTLGAAPSGHEDVFFSMYPMMDFHFNYPWVFRKFFSAGIAINTKLTRKIRPLSLWFTKLFSEKSRFEKQYWNIYRKRNVRKLGSLNPDLIIANDIYVLPLALKIAGKKSKVYFDAHEYHPRELEDNAEWVKEHQPFILYLCKEYMHKADYMTTVSKTIAEEYMKNYNVRAEVVTNATDFIDLKPHLVTGSNIKLIHHGAAIPERHLELMIDAMDLLDEKFTLDIMLVPTHPSYLDKLKEKSKKNFRITFIDPVPTGQIPNVLNKYDAGIIFIPPSNFNYAFCLPNKFYESIQGRLALVLGPTKDMVEIAEKYQNAVVAKDFTVTELVNAIKKLDRENINRMKMQSDVAAGELNAAHNSQKMLKTVKELLN